VLLNLAILVVSGLSGVLGTLGRILLSYLVHMHSRLKSLRQGQVHVGPITWEVLPHQEGLDPEREVSGQKVNGEFGDLAKLGCISWDTSCWIKFTAKWVSEYFGPKFLHP
jgi:hypothetical protein